MRHPKLPLAVLVLAAATNAQQLQWTTAHALPPRAGSAIAYDSARERVVLFGGSAAHEALADTWEWDGSAWIHRRPSTSPPARFAHCMAYDRARGRVVLFGGRSATSTDLGDTWEWDGTDWTQVNPIQAPPARIQAGIAFDSLRQRTVLFGGFGTVRLGDTWEYDGVAWTLMAPATSPAPRSEARMAYDSARSCTVLYGGYIGNSTFLRDTWEWDGTTWVQATTPVAPTSDYTGSLAFDSLRGRTVLYGGIRQFPFAHLDETWEWDGASWQQQTPVQRPTSKGPSLVAFDRARGRTVVCGSDTRSDVWQWDGTAWTQSIPDQSPAIGAPQLQRDDWNGQLLSFGTARNDTFEAWSWSGRRWTQLQPTLSPSLSNISAASDPLRLAIVLFGGTQGSVVTNQTWEWTGTTWTQALPAVSPLARFGHRMAFDPVTNRVLLFGGRSSLTLTNAMATTWAYDGTTWTQLAPATSPPGRSYPGMATDPVRQRVVMFGGFNSTSTALGDTWEWDGATWTLVATTGPSARGAVAMDYDPVGQRIVMFGGSVPAVGSVPGETWTWDGSTWIHLGLIQAPSARSHAGLAWDPQLGQHVLVGGLNCVGSCLYAYDTWALSTLAAPAVVPFGTGCGGPLGAPVHGGDEPYVGSDGFSLEVTNTPANAPCLFGVSAAQQAVPLGSGCTLYLGFTMDSWFTFANADGVARVRLSIPASIAFLGATVFSQAAVWDPFGPFGGLSLSAARQLTIGL